MKIGGLNPSANQLISAVRKSYEDAANEIKASLPDNEIDVSITEKSSGTPSAAKTFGETIKDAVNAVSELQNEADTLVQKVAAGDPVNVHEVMLAMQKASLAMQMTVQVRNKVVEAYQEIMRMQI